MAPVRLWGCAFRRIRRPNFLSGHKDQRKHARVHSLFHCHSVSYFSALHSRQLHLGACNHRITQLDLNDRTATKLALKNGAKRFSTRPPPLSEREFEVLSLLGRIKHPEKESEDIIFAGCVKKVSEKNGVVTIVLTLSPKFREIKALCQGSLAGVSWLQKVEVVMDRPDTAPARSTSSKSSSLSGVKRVLAVSSCKGGVGKSTVSINLAYALAQQGLRVGVFDADIYGPSLPTMVESPKHLLANDKGQIIPPEYRGVKVMSYGYVTEQKRKQDEKEGKASDQSVSVMRGPMVSRVVQQLVGDTAWGDLDVLVIDMPPGTGDIQLTLTQHLKLAGAVIVTTPQKISFVDVVKGVEMFEQMQVPVVAAVENMSYFTCGSCDTKHKLFGEGHMTALAERFAIGECFELPLVPSLSSQGDQGVPFMVKFQGGDQLSQGEAATFACFTQLAQETMRNLSSTTDSIPKVTYEQGRGVILTEGDSVAVINAYKLRNECQCAACVNELTGVKMKLAQRIPDDVHPIGISPRGNYAVAMHWSDGHSSSIYTFRNLRRLAQDACT